MVVKIFDTLKRIQSYGQDVLIKFSDTVFLRSWGLDIPIVIVRPMILTAAAISV